MSSNASLSERLRYAFDQSMSRGTIALIGWLAATTGVFLFVITVAVWATGIAPVHDDGTPQGFIELIWEGLMRTMDAGTLGGDTGSWPFLLSMLGVTLGGIFIFSTLIGVLTSGIEARVDELRKGRSRVIEEGHVVLLGWSPQVFTIVSELVIANQNQKRGCIVILGEHDKVEMEDAIRENIPDLKTTTVVCRTGSPIDLGDLDRVSVQTSSAIVVLAPDEDDPDASVIKSILAITNGPNRRAAPYHIVAEIHDPANMEAARLVGKSEAELVLAGDLISRITVQTCRQNGLSVVYTELLDFGGDEIYFKSEPALIGKTFGEALSAYEDSALLGLRRASGKIQLNPAMDSKIADGDRIIAISADDDTIRLSGLAPQIQAAAIRDGKPDAPRPERTLLLGWNWRASRIINGLDAYVAPGSSLVVLADGEVVEAALAADCANLKNQTLTFQRGDTTHRPTLEGLDVPAYDHIILLCSDQLERQRSDARVLVTLLHLRDMSERGGHDFSIVSEMLDVRNRALAEVTQADDFIVSERLVSLLMSQISQNKELNAVFQDLFNPAGSEIYVKPASDYVLPGQAVNFYTVVEAARRRGEIAIGYKIAALQRDAGKAYGVAVNPKKSQTVTFSAEDKVIVLAES